MPLDAFGFPSWQRWMDQAYFQFTMLVVALLMTRGQLFEPHPQQPQQPQIPEIDLQSEIDGPHR